MDTWAGLPSWARAVSQLSALGVILIAFSALLYVLVGQVNENLKFIPTVSAEMARHREAENYNKRTCIAVSVMAKLDPNLCEPRRPE